MSSLLWLVMAFAMPSLEAFTISVWAPNLQNNGKPYRLSPRFSQNHDPTAIEKSSSSDTAIDPLVMRILLQRNYTTPTGSVLDASSGIKVWRRVLLRGRLPVTIDFESDPIWPVDPLFSSLSKAMADLQLPRFVMRHPETITAVLMTMLRMTIDFETRRKVVEIELATDEETANEDVVDVEVMVNIHDVIEDSTSSSVDDEVEALAFEISSGFLEEYGGVLEGVTLLDQLFGTNHGLLDVQGDEAFGLQDGIWQHSGWKIIPSLQRQLQSMIELRDMVKSIGRRPTANENNNKSHRFAPRDLSPEGGMGAQFDPATRTSVSGLTLSSSLTEMLPSEAGLLLGRAPVLRRLFLAKKVESKLLSYQLSGWSDTPSIPRTNPRYRPRLPSGPGGPMVVCLDTSWSMSGARETLSKAVVLACVSAAHEQHRKCQVVAFSNERGVMDAGELTADPEGIERLLEFLSNSFGGGTDVTGALKYAMTTLGSDAMSAADLLLVTDGEIPDPPLREEMMQDLDCLKRRTGMQIHGLLVGNSESKPISRLCTHTYDFLIRHDMLASSKQSRRVGSTSLFALNQVNLSPFSPNLRQRGWRTNQQGRGRLSCHVPRIATVLYAQYSQYSNAEDSNASTRKRGKGRFDNGYILDDDDDNDLYYDSDEESKKSISGSSNDYKSRLEDAASLLRRNVEETMQANIWNSSELDLERNAQESCWNYLDELKSAVERVGENLVERDDEARLLVLSMIAGEHILFLGPPGTGKSVLGRRLSQLCGGVFFQRLLTRFTTPEEIFGPLSLRALENDEYRRCTAGFLPTASIAFLDEIFKANSAILNTLLTILNERQFDNGAGVREDCPIRCVVGASNELPESDELDALYDRFLVRKEVLSLSDEGVMKILSMPTPGFATPTTTSGSNFQIPFANDLDPAIVAVSKAAETVHMGDDVCSLMRDLRRFMKEKLNVDVSDRRLVKAARLLKISAASHGRTRVDPIDCLLLQHVVWRLPEQRSAIRDWLWDNFTPSSTDESSPTTSSQFRLLLENLRREAVEAVRKTGGDVTGRSGGRAADLAVIKSIYEEVSRISDLLKKKTDILSRHMELLARSMDHLWLERDEALSVKQLLLPKAKNASVLLTEALGDALALKTTLCASSIPDDIRLSVIENLWNDENSDISFTDEELDIGMKEAKSKYDTDTFRKWKRARKKASK
jgi:MoxR-like ATPase